MNFVRREKRLVVVGSHGWTEEREARARRDRRRIVVVAIAIAVYLAGVFALAAWRL